MCPVSLLLGAIIITIVVPVIGTIASAVENLPRPLPLYALPMTAGVMCGLVVVPAAIVISSPLSAIGAFSLSVVVSALLGRWRWGEVSSRGIFAGLGFGAMTTIVALIWVLPGMFGLLVLTSEGVAEALGTLGARCW